MAVKKRGLGKGLDALLGQHAASDLAELDSANELRLLPVDLLQRSPYQPRRNFDPEHLRELADSIRAQGIVQPIVVRPVKQGEKFEIIAGERRWRAAQQAGLHEVPAIVRNIDEQTAMCLALIENIQRQDLNALEEARAMSRLMVEFEMTHEAVAAAVGRSRSTVTNLLRLLDLNEKVKTMLEAGEVEMGHARAILGLPQADQLPVAQTVAKRALSVRATEALVRRQLAEKPGKDKGATQRPGKPDPNIERLELDLSERLGNTVRINHSRSGKGSLVIAYNSLDELDGILSRIK
ncbi:MAG: ParB/RepB/Spo0J family partition protein [Gammaproteobacteria bacterium]|nr:MAG: ParB/RepB/Spo0J family partition protein [Gammaproteobacteria bacterium]